MAVICTQVAYPHIYYFATAVNQILLPMADFEPIT